MPLSTGSKIGYYEIVSPIGAGGMGEVYRALDTRLNREVAIKVLPEALANDAQYMARFERDAQMMAGIIHRDLKPANIKLTPAGLVKIPFPGIF